MDPTTVTGWALCWTSGPDAGDVTELTLGTTLIGRAAGCRVRCSDPHLEAHHAQIEAESGETGLWITQLTGRTRISVDGIAVDGRASLAAGQVIDLGASRLRVDHRVAAAAGAVVHGGVLVRSPRVVPVFEPRTPLEPEPPAEAGPRPGGVLPALLALGGAAALALVIGQPMFLLFGALGAVVAAGSWAAQTAGWYRRRRRARGEHRQAVARHDAEWEAERRRREVYLGALAPGLAAATTTLTTLDHRLWQRRRADDDAFMVAIGSTVATDQVAGGSEPTCGPVVADLGPGCRVAVRGALAADAVRGLLVQLAANCGPADLRVVVATRHPERWWALADLPHASLVDQTPGIVDEAVLAAALGDLRSATAAAVLLVTDDAGSLAMRTSPLRRALDGDCGLLAVLDADAGVPQVCRSVLQVGSSGATGTARWTADTRADPLPVALRWAGVSAPRLAAMTACLDGLTDPEDPLSGGARLARRIALSDTLPAAAATPAGIVAAWAAAGHDPAPSTVLGESAEGTVTVDLCRDGPHGLIAGTTGAGKSELLRTTVVGIAARAAPQHVSFLLVDYKGGATFDACARLPHVVGVITDLDERLAERALRSLHAELRRREAVLREHGVAGLGDLRAAHPDVVLPRLVVVVDEFAALVAEQPAFLHALVGVAQRGRSLGIHLLLATQRPSGVISDDIRANTNLRIALRVQSAADALDVVGDPAPAALPRGIPGRAVMRLSADEFVTFQTAHSAGEATAGSELDELVAAIGEAARRRGGDRPLPPWQPPVPDRLGAADLPSGALGLLDDPDHQTRRPLHWTPKDGSLIVCGAAGMGVTSTLESVVASVLRSTDLDIDVVHADSGPGGWSALADHPRVVAVSAFERVRLIRLLHRWAERPAAALLVVDGLDSVRAALDGPEMVDEADALLAVLSATTTVVGVHRAAAVPPAVLTRCAHRWVLHGYDAHDATVLGVRAGQVPAAVPGRVFALPAALDGQLVEPHAHAPLGRARRRRPAIDDLAALLSPEHLAEPWTDAHATHLTVGERLVDGECLDLVLRPGEPVLVAGPPRSGRTALLDLIAREWTRARPNAAILRVGGGPTGEPSVPKGTSRFDATAGPVLVLVDDADRMADGAPVLDLLGRPGVVMVASGRADALRAGYGQWTAALRRGRCGVLLTGGTDLDGDLWGVALPRRIPLRPRPGLAWVILDGATQLGQLAWPCAPPADARADDPPPAVATPAAALVATPTATSTAGSAARASGRGSFPAAAPSG